MNINFVPLKFENKNLLKLLESNLKRLIGVESFTKKIEINFESQYSGERKQYYSTGILSEVIKKTDEIQGKIIILTEVDIYVPVLTFVFGEAQLNGKHSIISICRLHNEFYGMKGNNELLYERTQKEVLHELGHNFGLIHCIDWDCVMHSSNNIEEVDLKGDYYCSDCYNEIKIQL